MKARIFLYTILSMLISTNAYSGLVTEVTSNGNCSTSTVQITNITPIYPPDPSYDPGLSYPIDATDCLGYVTTPDNDWGNSPSPNKGGEGDGLLNGQISKDGYYIDGEYFLTNPKDSMIDLDGDGDATDPGWVRLGGAEVQDGDGNVSFVYDAIGDYDLDDILDITFNMNGTWSLSVDPFEIANANAALGRPSIFDHLAFVMKGPNTNNQIGTEDGEWGEWAIYDFNFHDLVDDGLDISFGDTAYAFTGTWDSSGVFDGKALSHLSIWAHDPPATQEIPEPTVWAAFIVLIWARLFRKTTINH